MNLHNQVNVSQRLTLIKVSLIALSAFAVVASAVVFSSGILSSSDSKAGTNQKTIYGKVFQDLNRNQVFDQDESSFEGARILLYEDLDGDSTVNASDQPIDETFTNAKGYYRFVLKNSFYESSIENQISSYEDDANEFEDGEMELNDNDLHIGYRLGATRFQNIDIPKGAHIKEAYIQFIAQDVKTGECTTKIFGESTGDAKPYSSEAFNISSRKLSSNYVQWSPADWAPGDIANTPSLASIVQEIVNHENWMAGNSMAFMYQVLIGHRDASTREEHLKKGAKIYISYTVGQSNQNYVVKIDKKSLPSGERNFGRSMYGTRNDIDGSSNKSMDFPLWKEAYPIEWSGLSLNESTDELNIEWTVEFDEHSIYFQIEKSYDKTSWFVLDEIMAQHTTAPLKYSSFDADTDAQSVVYYRVKRVDSQGIPTYSDVTSFSKQMSAELADVYPIPANDFIHVRPLHSQALNVSLVSQDGKILSSNQSNGLCTFNTSSLQAGVYYVRISNAGGTRTKKILIQH